MSVQAIILAIFLPITHWRVEKGVHGVKYVAQVSKEQTNDNVVDDFSNGCHADYKIKDLKFENS